MTHDAFASDLLALKKALGNSGYFQPNERLSSLQIVAYSLIYILTFFHVTIAFESTTELSWGVLFLGSIVVAFSSAKLGFILHDLGHFNCFQSKRKNIIYGQFIAALFLGVDFKWWLHKHQNHHLYPQVREKDPDLYETLLAKKWIKYPMKKSMVIAGLIASHILFYFQALSIVFVRRKVYSISFYLLLLRWLFFFVLCMFSPKMMLFSYFSILLTGLVFVVVFTPNHFPLERVEKIQHSKLEHQVYYSANLNLPRWLTLWFGSLPLQVEHHLVPEVPSHLIPSIQSKVRELVKKHHLPYQQFTIAKALKGAHQQIRSMS